MIAHVEKYVDLLKTLTGITALTSTRVYPYLLPLGTGAGELKKSASVVVSDTEKTVHRANAPVSDLVLEVTCYGETPEAANAVYRALHGALHGKRLTAGGVTWKGSFVGPPVTMIHEASRWHLVRCEVRTFAKTN